MLDYRRKLPHWQPDHVPLFVTWRLWGTLPFEKRRTTLCNPGEAFVAADRMLDQWTGGPVWLNDERIAQVLAEAIWIGESERRFYEVHAWSITPNHVHLLITPHVSLPVITRWLKGSTARKANQILGRTGQCFWQEESFDHWVRSQREFDRIVRIHRVESGQSGIRQVPRTLALVERQRAGETACPTTLISAAWQPRPRQTE